VSLLKKFLGLGNAPKEAGAGADGDTETVRRIASELDRLPPETAKFLAAQRGKLLQCLFAVAAADDTISGVESAEIAAIGEELGFTRSEINALRGGYRDKLSEFQNR
jgi:uncharacterized tellurite resistance protein B-like protein